MSTQKMSTFQAARAVFEQNKAKEQNGNTSGGKPEKKLTVFQQARLRFEQQGRIDEQVKKTNLWKGKPTITQLTAPSAAAAAKPAPAKAVAPTTTTSKPVIARTGSLKENPFLKDGNTTAAFQKRATTATQVAEEEAKPDFQRLPSRGRVSELKENFNANKVTIIDTNKRNYTPDQHRDQAKQANFSTAKQRFQEQCAKEKQQAAMKKEEELHRKPSLLRTNTKDSTTTESAPSTPMKKKEEEETRSSVEEPATVPASPEPEPVVAEQPSSPVTSPQAEPRDEEQPQQEVQPEDEMYKEHEEDELFQPRKISYDAPEHKQMTNANEHNLVY